MNTEPANPLQAARHVARHIVAITAKPELYNEPEQNGSLIRSIDSCRIIQIETTAGVPPVIVAFTYEPDKRLRSAVISYPDEKGGYIPYDPEPDELEALRTLAAEHLADLL